MCFEFLLSVFWPQTEIETKITLPKIATSYSAKKKEITFIFMRYEIFARCLLSLLTTICSVNV